MGINTNTTPDKEDSKDQESIQIPHLTPDTIWESDKTQETITYESSPFLAGDQNLQGMDKTVEHKQTQNRKDPQQKHRIGTVSKETTEGLNLFDSTNCTIFQYSKWSCCDQDAHHTHIHIWYNYP